MFIYFASHVTLTRLNFRFRMDVANDGTGIETAGWFRSSRDNDAIDVESMIMSRLCALHWVIVLYESVVPDPLKADVSGSSARH